MGASIPNHGESEGECNFYLFFPKEFLKKIAEILINDENLKKMTGAI